MTKTMSKYPLTIITTLSIFFLSLYASYGYIQYPVKMSVMHMFWAFLNAILGFCSIYLISKVPKISIIFVLLFSLVLTIDLTHLLAYGSRISFSGIASMMETNRVEAMGMGKQLVKYIIPCFILIFCSLFFAVKELKKKKGITKGVILIFLILSVILPSFLVFKFVNSTTTRTETFKEYPMLVIEEVIAYRYPIGYGTLFVLASYFEEKRKMIEFVGKDRVLPEGVELQDTIEKPKTIFVLIGESSLRTHYSVYGYNIQTTPFLDLLSIEHKMFKAEAISPATVTRDAVKMTLSFATPSNQQSFYDHKNAVDLAKLSGYETYWISNQDVIGIHDSFIGFIASCADHIEFHAGAKDDLELIDVANELCDQGKYQVFFIHLKGSHIAYGDKSDEIDAEAITLEDSGSNLIYLYDKSIHHTDRVIKSVYEKLKEKSSSESSLIWYYSDHGEIIGIGHGFIEHGIDQFLIPFLGIPVNSNIDIQKLVSPFIVDNQFNSMNFIHVFAKSIGYSISDERIQQSKKDGLTIYHVDRKVYNFSDIKK